MSSPKPENPALRAASILALKAKITEAVLEVDTRSVAVEISRGLPVINKELQARVKELARALYFLQSATYRNRDPDEGPEAFAFEEAILTSDLQTLMERRESEKDPDKVDAAAVENTAASVLNFVSAPVAAEDAAIIAAPLAPKLSELTQLISSPSTTAESARRVAGESLIVLSDIVHKLGFTEQVQEVAKRTSHLTLRLLGKTPNLSHILEKLKGDEGTYLTSHSLMLAEIASGLSCRVGWNSPATYLKLVIASYLHDLPFQSNKLAEENELPKPGDARFTTEEIEEIRVHPIKAAQFVTQFRELPPEIDTIILQHHELADGSGYPNGITHAQIHPLSALFIMAHDLLDYQLANPAQATIAKFQEASVGKYTQGNFKKLFNSLTTGTPVQL